MGNKTASSNVNNAIGKVKSDRIEHGIFKDMN